MTGPPVGLLQDARQTLQRWAPPDAAQQRLRAQYLELLGHRPQALWRDGAPRHLTASCHVLSPDARQVLLTLHRKARRWVQFGGHLEAGDRSLGSAALREAREESGVHDLRPLSGAEPFELHRHALPDAFGTCQEHWDVVFIAVTDRANLPAVSAESLEVAWWPVDELPPDVVADLPDRLGHVVQQVRALAPAQPVGSAEVAPPGASSPWAAENPSR